jgi:hypothetical protein
MPESELAFTRYFAGVPDPRANRTKKHALADILGVTLCAVICGADSFEEIERFGDARESWLKQYFPLENGIPSHDTFNRVLAALDRNVFATCFGQWMADLSTGTADSRPSPSTASRAGGHRATRSRVACTWSVRGRPRTG